MNTCVCDLSWGDCAKGKIVDILSEDHVDTLCGLESKIIVINPMRIKVHEGLECDGTQRKL